MKHYLIKVILTAIATGLITGNILSASPKLIRAFSFDESFTEDVFGNEPSEVLGSPSLVSGIFGQAIKLDGSSALIYDDYYDLHLEAFTMTAWISPTDESVYGGIVSKGADSYWIVFNHGEIKAGFYDQTPHETYSAIYLKPGQWYHIAISYDGEMLRLYIDDHLHWVKRVDSKPRRVDGPLIIGAIGHSPVSYFFQGLIDEVRLYNGALSKSEILNLYQKQKPTGPNTHSTSKD